MPKGWFLLLTCEHGGNKIPAAYASSLTADDKALLSTHRGWDAGALAVARQIQKDLGCTLISHEYSRLLVDCNRSIKHAAAFGPAFRDWDSLSKAAIADTYYWPYRIKVEQAIGKAIASGRRVLHCAVHSFTPVMNGEQRKADFGLLYDPARSSEKKWADELMEALRSEADDWSIRRNYPYLGKADGFTKYLRTQYPASKYAGFELEFNQSSLASAEAQKKAARIFSRIYAESGLSFKI